MKNEQLNAIGERLRLARRALNLSTRDVANQLRAHGKSYSHATIANYERGLTHPTEDVLVALAEIYNRPIDWLRGTGLKLQGVRYRCLKSVREHEKKTFESLAQGWLEAYLYIERLLNCLETIPMNIKVERTTSGKELAEQIRKKYKLDIYPLPGAVRLVENFRIYVIELDTNARIDAFAGRLGDFRVVVLNSSLPNDRIRLTVLHELAHHLYEDCMVGDSLPQEEIESRAFEFASNVLIPESQLKEAFELKSMVRLVQYKERFGISLAAMIYRAKRSKLIPSTLYQRLWRDFGRLGYNKIEPGYVAPDRPRRMEALIDAAVSQNIISYKEVARIVGTNEESVTERIFRAMGGNPSSRDNKDPSIINFQQLKHDYDN